MVEFRNVSKLYDTNLPAVEDLSFEIKDGEFVFLIGPSGSGKTTVIKMLIRDEVPTEGSIFFNDIDITRLSRRKIYKLRREIGVIFQDFKLVQDKTAYENVAFAMEAAGKKNHEIEETVPYVLDIVGLSNRMNAFPRQLSGGEQQRVAIARAIANNPKILIADEPTGNLDPASAWDIVQVLTKINNWGTTVIMSTHGTDIVNSLNKRVIQMEKGKIVRDDNKGQYEITSKNIEQQLKNQTLELVEEPKKKKQFSVKIPKNINVEASTESNEQVNEETRKEGVFSKLFGRKKEDPFEMNEESIRETLTSEEAPSLEDIKPKKDKIKRPLMVEKTENAAVEESQDSKNKE